VIDRRLLRESVLDGLRCEAMGIYEVWYHANGFSDEPMSERFAAAEDVVRDLANEGVVTLWIGHWIGPQQEREPLELNRLDAVLRAFRTWVPDAEEPTPWMMLATPPDESEQS
jgi:hypothetical protein